MVFSCRLGSGFLKRTRLDSATVRKWYGYFAIKLENLIVI